MDIKQMLLNLYYTDLDLILIFIIGFCGVFYCNTKIKDIFVKYKVRLSFCCIFIIFFIVLGIICTYLDAQLPYNHAFSNMGAGNLKSAEELAEIEMQELQIVRMQKIYDIVRNIFVAFYYLSIGIFMGFIISWLFKEDRQIIKPLNNKVLNSRVLIVLICSICEILFAYLFGHSIIHPSVDVGKPVIYLYGYDEKINVQIDFDENTEFTVTYPEYNDGWNINALPDGELIDDSGRKYKYLYYEATTDNDFDITSGFCVANKDVSEFLYNTLKRQGLTDYEIEDFITYWLPKMQKFDYSVICFDSAEYEKIARLNIDKKPDEMIRIYMIWYGSNEYVDIEPQILNTKIIDRNNKKVVVEWGGTQL